MHVAWSAWSFDMHGVLLSKKISPHQIDLTCCQWRWRIVPRTESNSECYHQMLVLQALGLKALSFCSCSITRVDHLYLVAAVKLDFLYLCMCIGQASRPFLPARGHTSNCNIVQSAP